MTDPKTQHWFERVVKDLFKPNAETFAEILARDGIAVALFEPMALAQATARMLGWNGSSPVFEMPRKVIKPYARRIERDFGDEVCADWLTRRRGPGRIFLLVHAGNLLINVDSDGYWLEPGSLDAERKRASH